MTGAVKPRPQNGSGAATHVNFSGAMKAKAMERGHIKSSMLLIALLLSAIPCAGTFWLPQHHRRAIQEMVCHITRPPFAIDDGNDDRLVDIRRALERMQSLQNDQVSAAMEELQKRIQKEVVCRESSIPGAGQGIFALRNIKAGCVVGFYPVHGIGVDFEDASSVCIGATLEDQQHFDEMDTDEEAGNNYIQYLIGSRRIGAADFGDDGKLFVNVNPSRTDGTGGWIGHYINDGATVATNSEKGMLDYYSDSLRRKNCVHVPFGPAPLIATVTTRKVKKGEELFTSYGCLYWIEAMLQQGEICADVTDAVQMGAKQTAQDLFTAMQGARTTYVNQQDELQREFADM